MKKTVLIMGVFAALAACKHGGNPRYIGSEVNDTYSHGFVAHPPAAVASASNPIIPVHIKEETCDAQKKKVDNILILTLSTIKGFFSSVMNLGEYSIYPTVFVHAYSADEDQEEENNYRMELEEEDYNNRQREIKKFNQIQKELLSYTGGRDGLQPDLLEESCIPGRGLGAKETRQAIHKQIDHLNEHLKHVGEDTLYDAFSGKFKALKTKKDNIEAFVKKGVKNARKNLVRQAKLTRAYTSSVAQDVLDRYDNTVRSAALLGDLVKKGVVTAKSAASELARAATQRPRAILHDGYENIKNAASDLFETASGTVDGVIKGLRDSPAEREGLAKEFPDIAQYHRKLLSPQAYSPKTAGRSNRFEVWLNPKPALPRIEAHWEEMGVKVEMLQSNFRRVSENISVLDSKYNHRLQEITDDLSKTLVALQSRLGTDIALAVPGIETHQEQFKTIIEGLKSKTDQTISGTFSPKGLLDYSMDISEKLHNLDALILSFFPTLTSPGVYSTGGLLASGELRAEDHPSYSSFLTPGVGTYLRV
ncbi:hypothetical protein NEDG_01715 [Nematocida displodere]|uniref:Lipoprotein n=1 Tax=Nematocida displodere TaxID=1805483 RepID=A0A177EG81_9MICR|nr:hypothetical protein NEDG_01715 [Nematocida displodere]